MAGRTLPILALLLLLAGCSGPAADDPTAPVDDAPQAAAAEWPMAGDGTLALGNCVSGSPVGDACVFNVGDPTSPTQAGNILHFPIDGANGTVAASATLAWDASSPLTDELELRFSLLDCDGQSCSTAQVLATATGASPLLLDLPATAIPPGKTLGVTVGRAELAQGNRVSLLQEVHVDAVAVAAMPAAMAAQNATAEQGAGV